MSTEPENGALPREMRQFLMELQLQHAIRNLQGQIWSEYGELSRKDTELLRRAYLSGLADGLDEVQPAIWRELPMIEAAERGQRRTYLDAALQAVTAEYCAKDRALDRLVALLGKVLREHPGIPEYRSRMQDILYELDSGIAELRGRGVGG
jgi:hypothetical protein